MTCQNQINVLTVFGFARRFEYDEDDFIGQSQLGLLGFFQWSFVLTKRSSASGNEIGSRQVYRKIESSAHEHC